MPNRLYLPASSVQVQAFVAAGIEHPDPSPGLARLAMDLGEQPLAFAWPELGRRGRVCGTRRKPIHGGSFAPSMALYGP
ncbi:hypothetical protein, partial [Stenotrophomonas sp. PS02300]|uniref:hypothetical protein n=1 Tax=Stenotrophomonas sp. PS02300 TaxID=2991426 RepID=UPI00249CB871